MAYFTQDFLDFFKELAANNHKDWFHANKKRYEASVKDPFKLFVQDMIDKAAKVDGRFAGEAKNAIFRINRDIRFSKDKSPYKLQMGAVISPGGKRRYGNTWNVSGIKSRALQVLQRSVHAPERGFVPSSRVYRKEF